MDGTSHERAAGEGESQRRETARGRAGSRHNDTMPAARRCKTAIRMRGRETVANSRCSANRETFEAAADVDMDAYESGQHRSTQPLRDKAGDASAKRTTSHQRDRTPRSCDRFGNRQPCTDTCTSGSAATASDSSEHRNNCKRRGAAGCRHEDQTSQRAGGKSGQSSTNRRSGPPRTRDTRRTP